MANFGEITSNTAIPAGKSIRRSVDDTAFESYSEHQTVAKESGLYYSMPGLTTASTLLTMAAAGRHNISRTLTGVATGSMPATYPASSWAANSPQIKLRAT